MTQADRVHSTPPTNTTISQSTDGTTSRRRFLSNAAGLAAGGAALALAIPPVPAAAAFDPVYDLIEAHRTAHAAHLVALEEQNRLERIGDPLADTIAEESCYSDMDAFQELIETAPTTSAGLLAWVSYFGELSDSGDAWMFDEAGPTLVATLAEALENLAVGS